MRTLIVFKSDAFLVSEDSFNLYCKTDRRKKNWKQSLLDCIQRYHPQCETISDLSNNKQSFLDLRNSRK